MSEVEFLVGKMLVEVRYGTAIRLVFDVGERVEPALYVNIEQAFHYVDRDGRSWEAGMDRPDNIGRLLWSVGQTVTKAEAMEDGSLGLTFSDGSSFRCPPHPDWEAWQVVGGTPQGLVVCMPGGELAVWDSRTPPMTLEQADAFFARFLQREDGAE